MQKKYALDVFELLDKINDPSIGDIYSTLTSEEKAAFAPFVIMRWMSGTSDKSELLALNEFMNQYAFSLGKHPHLLMQMLQACSSKRKKRYNWVSAKGDSTKKLSLKVMQEYMGMTSREAQKVRMPSGTELLKMAENIGWQPDEITKLKKELSK
jgi:hypothetical protein